MDGIFWREKLDRKLNAKSFNSRHSIETNAGSTIVRLLSFYKKFKEFYSESRDYYEFDVIFEALISQVGFSSLYFLKSMKNVESA